MERWQNKVAVVTGASSGIGAAICKDLIAKGMIVIGFARRLLHMENELKAKLSKDQQSRFLAVYCDVTRDEDIIAAFLWIEMNVGGVAVLINNAGILRRTQIIDANNTQDLKAVLDTNVLGVALCTREAFQSMQKHGIDGHVFVINSVLGHIVPNVSGFDFNMYPPSKHAITAMTEILRQEFLANKTKIKVTSISPGLVDTEIYGDSKASIKDLPSLLPQDIADAVAYCLQTPPNVQIHELTMKPLGAIC